MSPTSTRRRVYLHAGLHKTGTSSIQIELTRARHLLAAKGFLYPRVGIPDWVPYGQHLLPWSVVRRDGIVPPVHGVRASISAADRDSVWEALHREIENCGLPNVVLSSEEFDILDSTELKDLRQRLERYDVVPIIFLRSFADLLESSYRTAVAHSEFTNDIAAYVRRNRTRLDLIQFLRDWKAVSSGTLFAVSYDDKRLRADSVLTFLNLMGLGADAVEPERLPKQNESIPAFLVEIIRFMRNEGSPEADIQRWRENMARLSFDSGVNQRYTLLPPDLRARLDGRYSHELAALAEEPALAQFVHGRLVIPERLDQVSCIRTIQEALKALGEEIAAR